MLITSTFSPGMIARAARQQGATLLVKEIGLDQAKDLVQAAGPDCRSAVGHPATAALMARLLEQDIPFERTALALTPPAQLLVFQLDQAVFRRLGEGEVLGEEDLAQALDQGAIVWLHVSLVTQ